MRRALETLRRSPDTDETRAPFPAGWQAGVDILCHGADPVGALALAASLPDPILARDTFPAPLARLLHQGGYAARLLALDPAAVRVLDERVGAAAAAGRATLVDELRDALNREDAGCAIGRVRTREYLRLARREVEGAPLEEVGGDLSDLVAAAVQVGLEHVAPTLHDQVTVFGMGKLGGGELNFLSDIDLVFVHADGLGTGEADGRRVLAELHGALRRLVRILEGEGMWRPLFRVDMRLRPFGTRGPLSMSLAATESYYERHGRSWERQVWIRARPIAGNQELGKLLMERLIPFVYRRNVGPSIFEEVSSLMLRARREARAGSVARGGVDVKHDAGGIRDVEFFVQALQLLHGGKNPSVRSRSTLDALRRLLAAGLVSDREHGDLADSYRLLRRIEHRLQLMEGQHTHRVPADPEDRSRLGRRLSGSPGGDPLAFVTELDQARSRVSVIAQTLHGDQDPEAIDLESDEQARARAVVLDPGAPPARQAEALAHLGVRDVDEVGALLHHLRAREESAFCATGAPRRGAEALLLACLDSSDPDAALRRLAAFAQRRPGHLAIWRHLAGGAAGVAETLRLTAELFGSSESLSLGLIGFPFEGGRATHEDTLNLVGATQDPQLGDAQMIADRWAVTTAVPGDLDGSLLRFKHAELVRIGLADLARRPDPLHVGRALSDLADHVVSTMATDLAAAAPPDDPHAFDLAVFGLGKLGMQAMDYGSDLDLLFVYRPAGSRADPRTAAVRFAQRLISRLGDARRGARLYEVDMRLRPSGRQGLLVSSLVAFEHYHRKPLPIWEQMAMLRLRPVVEIRVGGSTPVETDGLCRAVAERILPASLFGAEPPVHLPDVGRAAHELKDRIEHEHSRETRTRYEPKMGRGGVLELELMVAALQLHHGRRHPEVRVRGIVEALNQLAAIGAISGDTAHTLGRAYRFLRLLLNRLRMGRTAAAGDTDRFSVESPRLEALARRMGLPDRQTLLHTYLDCRESVRGAFDRLLR